MPFANVEIAYRHGLRHFGENYPQELRDKSALGAILPGIRWHAIGPLQLNKVKYVAKSAHLKRGKIEANSLFAHLGIAPSGGILVTFEWR